jgi:hypothetical protein
MDKVGQRWSAFFADNGTSVPFAGSPEAARARLVVSVCTGCGGPDLSVPARAGRTPCSRCAPAPTLPPYGGERGVPSLMAVVPRHPLPAPPEPWPAPVVPRTVVESTACGPAAALRGKADRSGWRACLTYAMGYESRRDGPTLAHNVAVRMARDTARRVAIWGRRLDRDGWEFISAYAWGDQVLTRLNGNKIGGSLL